jgi:uncharacterized protein YeaO (DUF488 family)
MDVTWMVKRVYEAASAEDGKRVLVERLWPRGKKKEDLPLDEWRKDVAPSQELRTWYAHDLARWEEFQRRYRAELLANPSGWQPLLEAGRQGKVTLLYSAHDEEHNSAVLLKTFLENQAKG